MPKYIVKAPHPDTGEALYAEFSTIVDAPITYFCPLDVFTEYYREKYGTEGMREFPERMERVEERGTSAWNHKTFESTVSLNRAGPRESCLTPGDMVKAYLSPKAWCNWTKMGKVFDPNTEEHISAKEAVKRGLLESTERHFDGWDDPMYQESD